MGKIEMNASAQTIHDDIVSLVNSNITQKDIIVDKIISRDIINVYQLHFDIM